jgi:hypothetical protein
MTRPDDRRLLWLGAPLAAVLVVAIVVVAFVVAAPDRARVDAAWRPAVVSQPSLGSSGASPSATPKVPVSASRGTSSHPPSPKPTPHTPTPTPTRKKTTTLPPPQPKPSPVTGCTKPFYVGTNAPMSSVRSALATAASTQVWTVSHITLPNELINAVAWQESGWQSAIRACDGGIGTMQVMPDTATMMNNRFDAHWDVTTLAGNTMIGSAYLQWLVKYFGDAYFDGNYTLDATACASDDPDVPDYETPCLLNAVIAAYNFGAGAVGQDTIVIPNPNYVSDVRALMVACPCDQA